MSIANCPPDISINRHSIVTTVRSQEKAEKIKEAHPGVSSKQLDFAIVEDIAKEGAFDEAVKSDPPFEAVIHTASPFHFNVTDVQKVSNCAVSSAMDTADSGARNCLTPPSSALREFSSRSRRAPQA